VKWALLEGLDDERARVVLSHARRRKFGRGEIVFHEGDPGDTIHLIDKGHVAVRVTTPLGDTATLHILKPGDYFGELAVIAPAPRAATIVALEPTETLALHADVVDRLRAESPDIDRVLIDALVREVRRLSLALLEAMYVPASTRLARQLLTIVDSYPRTADGRTTIPLTQDDLAGLVGTTRPTVNQMLGKLADKGCLELARGKVIITDHAGLAKAAR
jgi:CRP-like cAMP-binding protein